jgi:hypothetical protein
MFVLSDGGQKWEDRGAVTVDNSTFWPMDTPQPIGDGQWIMGGLGGPGGKRPAVAVAHQDNLHEWKVCMLPLKSKTDRFKGYGETTVITKDRQILTISRKNGMCKSSDGGSTWQGPWRLDIPMESAKPYGGRLRDGRPYLVCNIQSKVKRSRLCLLLGQPGGMSFDRVWLLRPGDPPAQRFKGPNHNPQWAYPYAWESDQALVVVHHNAKEDIEMITVPLVALK